MARRVITYDEAFQIIENTKPKEMDFYLQEAAKENAIGIYTEMHNYIHNNIVELDFDVDLFTEAFSWDKSKGFWANIWAWILNVWGAIKNFFLALFGKNETYTKEEVDKIKSTAESAKSAVESGNVSLDAGALDGLTKLLEHMKNLEERLSDKDEDIANRSSELSDNDKKKEMNDFLEKDFKMAEKAIEDCIKSKAIMRETQWGQKIVIYLNNIINKFNSESNLTAEQQEHQHIVAISFALLTVYNNILIMLGFIIKNMSKYTAPDAKKALKAACELLMVNADRKTQSSGAILKGFGQCIYTLKAIGVTNLMDIFDSKGTNSKKLVDENLTKEAATNIEAATGVSITGGQVKLNTANGQPMEPHKILEDEYNKISSNKLNYPMFDSTNYIVRADPKSVISAEEMKDRSDFSKLDTGNIDKTSDNGVIAADTDLGDGIELSSLKKSLPLLASASSKVLKGATIKAASGKDFINKIYKFLADIKTANKNIDITKTS